ncbi:MAG: hypothetical protein OES79_05250 [Planctomycetota bacterium]|nr:hypothetical protein [Planctomycetota bacterium]
MFKLSGHRPDHTAAERYRAGLDRVAVPATANQSGLAERLVQE